MTSKYEQQARARKRKRKVHEVQIVAKDGKGKKYYTYDFDGGKKKYPGDGNPKAKTIKKYTKNRKKYYPSGTSKPFGKKGTKVKGKR